MRLETHLFRLRLLKRRLLLWSCLLRPNAGGGEANAPIMRPSRMESAERERTPSTGDGLSSRADAEAMEEVVFQGMGPGSAA